MEKGKIKLAILSAATLIMGAQIITGIIAAVAAHYPDVPQSRVTLLLTLPFLIGTLFALAAGPLSKFTSKKNLVIASHISLLTGCLAAYMFGEVSINVLLATSVLMGISQGMLSTLTMGLIADFFDGDERGALMGLQSSFTTFGGMIMVFVGAALAGIYWKNTYLILLVAVPSLFIVLKYLPSTTPVQDAEPSGSAPRGSITKAAWFYIFIDCVYGVFCFILQANLAFYISQQGYGGADVAGYANSTLVAAGGITGFLYGRLSKVFGRFILPLGLFVSVLGYLLLYFIGSLPSVFIASACIGFGLTATVATVMFNASNVVAPSSSTMAIALANTFGSIGIFASPIITGYIMKAIGSGELRTQFLVGAVGMGALAIVYMIGDAAIAKQYAADPAQAN